MNGKQTILPVEGQRNILITVSQIYSIVYLNLHIQNWPVKSTEITDVRDSLVLRHFSRNTILIVQCVKSALPYVNNVPHLGNIVGSVLSADVFSR